MSFNGGRPRPISSAAISRKSSKSRHDDLTQAWLTRPQGTGRSGEGWCLTQIPASAQVGASIPPGAERYELRPCKPRRKQRHHGRFGCDRSQNAPVSSQAACPAPQDRPRGLNSGCNVDRPCHCSGLTTPRCRFASYPERYQAPEATGSVGRIPIGQRPHEADMPHQIKRKLNNGGLQMSTSDLAGLAVAVTLPVEAR